MKALEDLGKIAIQDQNGESQLGQKIISFSP